MLDTKPSCLKFNYRSFWEICQLQHPITNAKSTELTKTFSRRTVPMVGHATITFCYDPDGHFVFPLTVWITELETQNPWIGLLPKTSIWVPLWLAGTELKNPPNSLFYGCFHQNNFYPHLSQILTVHLTYTMHIDAKSARCWKYSPYDSQLHVPPGSYFQLNRQAVSTRLSFINTLCTRSGKHLPLLMENNKKHQITFPRGRIGFSCLEVLDREEPKDQIRSPCELTNAINATGERYKDCLFLHSTIPAQSGNEFLQIVYENENSIIQQPNSIGHRISADAKVSKVFAEFILIKFLAFVQPAKKQNSLLVNQRRFLGF